MDLTDWHVIAYLVFTYSCGTVMGAVWYRQSLVGRVGRAFASIIEAAERGDEGVEVIRVRHEDDDDAPA